MSQTMPQPSDSNGQEQGGRAIVRIEVDGYRAFHDFVAEPGDLTVFIGANATGKSSLFDFLRFLSQGVADPLPPEIDSRSVGKTLFHLGSPERICWRLTMEAGETSPLRYEAEVTGPIGSPRIARESLVSTGGVGQGDDGPFTYLEFSAGKGLVRDHREKDAVRPEWAVRANELALRRAFDPTLVTLLRVQDAISGWRFYSGFDIATGTAAPIRRPTPTDPSPVLKEDGSNLSALLFWLKSEHPDAWAELESALSSAVPGFLSLHVKPRGGPGTVMGVWREADFHDELSLADLSDGTLRFLCWAALCVSPNPPTLLCIDEPELGLHPRVLPILAGLLRMASGRTQILVATHSPRFLATFALDEIAVMRKENGAARFVRPASSKALKEMVEEIGGDAIIRLFASDELEVLP